MSFRNDGKLLENLTEAAEVLWQFGCDGLSKDVEEAIARLKLCGYPQAWREKDIPE